jgi:hypothetical protein
MNPQEHIEKTLSDLEHNEALIQDAVDEFAWLFVSVIQRFNGIYTDEAAWPQNVEDHPVNKEIIESFIKRLSKIIDLNNDSRTVATLLFPLRRYADPSYKTFYERNLRKWLKKENGDKVVYNLLLCLDDIGEKPFKHPGPRGSSSEDDVSHNREDAIGYLKRN